MLSGKTSEVSHIDATLSGKSNISGSISGKASLSGQISSCRGGGGGGGVNDVRVDGSSVVENDIAYIDLTPYATDSELDNYATKSELDSYATKSELSDYAEKSDLDDYATKSELDDYATKSELSDYATKAELDDYATKTDLDDYATKTDLNDYATKAEIPTDVSELNNDAGYIDGLFIASYGKSTFAEVLDAYTKNKIVYARASSNSNPATGSQTRLAFMAYVNNAENPTEIEFQYYRSVSSHSASQQGDQVYVYKLNKSTGWSVTVREAYTKIAVGAGLTSSYSNGTITISLA